MLLKSCRYIVTQNPARDILEGYDIRVEGGSIKEIGKGLSGEGVDCSNRIVMPGLINLHGHYGMHLLKGVCDDEQLMQWLGIVMPKEQELRDDNKLSESAKIACEEMLLTGTTTIADGYWPMEPLIAAVDKSGIRAVFFTVLDELKKIKFEHPRITWGVAAHSIYHTSLDDLQKAHAYATEHDIFKTIHIAETRKERFDSQKKFGKLPVEYLEEIGWLDGNTLLAHAVWVTKGEIKILKKHDVKVAHCPISNMKLASGGVMPLPEMKEEGVCVGLGTDSVVSNNNLDMFEEMKVTGLLHKHHRWDARTAPQQYILDMATINGAKCLGMEDSIGSLEVGKKADIITLNVDSPRLKPINNVLSTVIYSAQGGDVSEVLVDGKLLVRDGKWE